MTSTAASDAVSRTPLLAPRYRAATVGTVALIFLAAFEALAVATVMPVVTADLDARAWYSVAFSATLAASVVGMVLTGLWSDRAGAARPLLTAVAGFAVGLLLAGLATGVVVLVVARVLQGLGAGGLVVALYVLVGQVYDPVDRPRILGLFAAAWVLPGLVGPFLAGVVAETVGWRWVFLGVVALALGALALLAPSLRGLHGPGPTAPDADPTARTGGGARRVALAVAVAGGLLALNLAVGLDGATAAALAAVAVLGVLLLTAPLLPAGTLRVRRGLPAVVATRGLLGATFFATEAYLPYLLQEQYAVSPGRSGLVLTAATLGWAAASHVQGRLGGRLPDATALRLGVTLELTGIGLVLAVAALDLPGALVGAGWLVASTGMGLAYPRTTASVLARTEARERGSASSALTIAEAVAASAVLALAGLLFTALGSAADRTPFVGVLAGTTALAAVGVLVARRA